MNDADQKSGKRHLLLRDDGEELSADIDEDAADMLVRLLQKINSRLRRTRF